MAKVINLREDFKWRQTDFEFEIIINFHVRKMALFNKLFQSHKRKNTQQVKWTDQQDCSKNHSSNKR